MGDAFDEDLAIFYAPNFDPAWLDPCKKATILDDGSVSVQNIGCPDGHCCQDEDDE